MDEESSSVWSCLPDSLLLYVFSYLPTKDLIKAGQTCNSWRSVSHDQSLWKVRLYRDWHIDPEIPLPEGVGGDGSPPTHLSEYRRLRDCVPRLESQVLRGHADQVLHVAFSHSGQLFATCSKDGTIKVWTAATIPIQLKHSKDMKELFRWQYTHFSQFNASDSLLLVSGIHFGPHSTSGEIAVFNVKEGFVLQARVLNKPYDILGTWLNNSHLLSGNLHYLGHLSSCSSVWLNKATQEVDSEQESVVMRILKFLNINASVVRNILVANYTEPPDLQPQAQPRSETLPHTFTADCWESNESATETDFLDARLSLRQQQQQQQQGDPGTMAAHSHTAQNQSSSSEPKVSPATHSRGAAGGPMKESQSSPQLSRMSASLNLPTTLDPHYDLGHRPDCSHSDNELLSSPTGLPTEVAGSGLHVAPLDGDNIVHSWGKQFSSFGAAAGGKEEEEEGPRVQYSRAGGSSDNLSSAGSLPSDLDYDSAAACQPARPQVHPRQLVFTKGALSYTPHQVGIKRIHPGLVSTLRTSLKTSLRHAASPAEHSAAATYHHHLNLEFDKVDHTIELHGHITGLCLSPDHRFLFVNVRTWPDGYHISDPLKPPPIAREMELREYDLTSAKLVRRYLGHKAYSANDELNFLAPNACGQYVASGAEDLFAYLWDRHYAVCVAKLPHRHMVSSVAFNPSNSGMVVTVSGNSIRVWHSRLIQMNQGTATLDPPPIVL